MHFALVHTWGLTGLFFAAFLGSTIFVPFSVEMTFPVLISAEVDKLPILLVATIGSTLGTMVNYYLGYKGIQVAGKYVKEKDVEKATHLMNKYGWIGLLAAMVVPFLPVDPLTIICGVAKMNLREFTIVVVVGKVIKYALVLGLLAAVIPA